MTDKIILQKFIAMSGVYSRRQAEELIRRGKVTVNGKIAELGMKADEYDDVRVNGKRLILAKEKIYIILNKPSGYVCSNRRFPGEKNVFELIDDPHPLAPSPNLERGSERKRAGERDGFGKLIISGRLDKDSHGLVLLTNDGDLALKLTHPRYGHVKVYEVRSLPAQAGKKLEARSALTFEVKYLLDKLKYGVEIGEGDGVVRARRVKYLGENKFEIVLTEGKKRQIRRMFRAVGYEVDDIKRIAIGKLELGRLKEGEWRYLSKEEIVKLLNG